MKLNVKWGKEIFKDVEVDMEQPPEMFKMQLYSLTGVPSERQKVMVKGGLLKNDSWANVKIQDGATINMIGTAEQLPVVQKEDATFLEDLPEDEQAAAEVKDFGSGLENLGNTCFMNACLQCLYAVPELAEALKSASTDGLHGKLAMNGRALFAQMARGFPIAPWQFLTSLRQLVPQFNEMSSQVVKSLDNPADQARVHAQQDAEECWGAVLTAFRAATRKGDADPIYELFSVKMRAELRCSESEETYVEETTALNLKCNINAEVAHLTDGMKLALVEDREKHSENLGRVALWKGNAKVAHLPEYLTVQSMRFFYKVEARQKAKIFRAVSFPLQLDLFDLCTPELQVDLKGPRAACWAIEESLKGPQGGSSAQKNDKPPQDKEAGADRDSEMAGTAEAGAMSDQNFTGKMTGRFDLVACLTHRGRTLDSGHYVAWVKQKGDDCWIQFDDEKLIPRKSEEILALKGGGDWHTAYLLLYKAQRVPAKEARAVQQEAH